MRNYQHNYLDPCKYKKRIEIIFIIWKKRKISKQTKPKTKKAMNLHCNWSRSCPGSQFHKRKIVAHSITIIIRMGSDACNVDLLHRLTTITVLVWTHAANLYCSLIRTPTRCRRDAVGSSEDVLWSNEHSTTAGPIAGSIDESGEPGVLITWIDDLAADNPARLLEVVHNFSSVPPVVALANFFLPIYGIAALALGPPFVFVLGTIGDPNIEEAMSKRGGGGGGGRDGDHHFALMFSLSSLSSSSWLRERRNKEQEAHGVDNGLHVGVYVSGIPDCFNNRNEECKPMEDGTN